ncbi:hypothetical protein SBRCBS47491_002803 [Sporothrix bragantina]|uniref:Uncharacterized protein n=1 Tax=Sporothrix bragantina TaxID=671064 RepID=A0ABP0BA83_9PEZI
MASFQPIEVSEDYWIEVADMTIVEVKVITLFSRAGENACVISSFITSTPLPTWVNMLPGEQIPADMRGIAQYLWQDLGRLFADWDLAADDSTQTVDDASAALELARQLLRVRAAGDALRRVVDLEARAAAGGDEAALSVPVADPSASLVKLGRLNTLLPAHASKTFRPSGDAKIAMEAEIRRLLAETASVAVTPPSQAWTDVGRALARLSNESFVVSASELARVLPAVKDGSLRLCDSASALKRVAGVHAEP